MPDRAGPDTARVGEPGRVAYSPAEVERACGLSRKAIYRTIATGELRAARVCGGSWLLIASEEVRAWMARSIAPVESPARPEIDLSPRREVRTPLRDALQEGRAA
jgi:excisionase family DNA binding protein